MPSWVAEHKSDITFLISVMAGILLIVGGFFTGRESTILLGAGVLGVPGFSYAVKGPE